MPVKIPLSEYKSHMATKTGREMVKEEEIRPALHMEKVKAPSASGFVGYLKENMKAPRLLDMGQKVRGFGSAMRYISDASREAGRPEGVTPERLMELDKERKRRME